MNRIDRQSRLLGACCDVERACRELEAPTPEGMERSAQAFRSAIERLRDVHAGHDRIDSSDAERLQQATKTARMLLEQANQYYACLRRILLGIPGDYAPQGAIERMPSGWRCWQRG